MTENPPRTAGPVLRRFDEITTEWLGAELGRPVSALSVIEGSGNWSKQARLHATFGDGGVLELRLKLCLGQTFGRSEVDYYTRDYVDLANAPLVRCHSARFDPSVGYHLLLEDLSGSHHDRRDVTPTLEHGHALAQALAALHKHHWQSLPAPGDAVLSRYLDEVRPGLTAIEAATGCAFTARHAAYEKAFRARWANPLGMTLLHGDLNPTNVLTPKQAEGPVLCLDRQPFDWSLTYGLAVYDLAYATVPWWPEPIFRTHQQAILRHWHEQLDQPEYSWDQAQQDWRLSVAQCLDVPLEWCSKAETLTTMRWLWEAQLQRIEAAVQSVG